MVVSAAKKETVQATVVDGGFPAVHEHVVVAPTFTELQRLATMSALNRGRLSLSLLGHL
jgi:hypothetical protein